MIQRNPSLSWEGLADIFPPLRFYEIVTVAQALEASRKEDDAFHAYREAWRMRPDDPLVNLRLGRIYVARGNDEEAIVAFNKTLARLPRNLYALSSLIYIYEHEGRMDLAQSIEI